MSTALELRKLAVYRRQLEDERLAELSFEEAFEECLALMELSLDMVESMASPAGLKRIQSGASTCIRPSGVNVSPNVIRCFCKLLPYAQ